jgi:hypothetical protein
MKEECRILKKSVAGFELGVLVLSLFAFSYMIYSIDVVGADPLTAEQIASRSEGLGEIGGGSSLSAPVSKAPIPVGDLTSATGLLSRSGGTLYFKEAATGAGVVVPEGTAITLAADGSGTYMVGSKTFSLTAPQIAAAKSSGQIGVQTSTKLVSKQLGLQSGYFADALVSGLVWAGIAYLAGMMVGSLLGMTEGNTEALSTSMAAGFGAYRFFSTFGEIAGSEAWGWLANPLVGIGIGVIVFLVMYRDVDTEVVTFDCLPWQAPSGGNDCEICNDDDLPCSEYRCKALGQNCEIVNEGTVEERCVNINPRDVDPPIIKPRDEALSSGHGYRNVRTSPPGPGFEIVNLESGDGCLKAFTPLEFGIDVNEPAQCKIDFEHTTSFDEMRTFFGGSSLYSYEHGEKFSLPSAEAFENSSLVLENGKDIVFYIRCKDKNGNENEAEYAVKMCVDPTPDNTAPKIEATSVANGGCVAENQDSAVVEFYTNEPADCRWSPQNQDYENMANGMTCSSELYQMNAAQLFSCKANLTGISRDDTKFYVRCKDQPGAEEANRNVNRESFEFSLRGSTGLKLRNLQPNGTVYGAVSPMPVELYAETLFGCNDGLAICQYSATGDINDYIRFFDTNNEDGIHTQRLDLVAGTYEYFVRCIDEGGNLVNDSIVFTLDIDTAAPVVARIYEEDGMLKIVTVRDSECAYSFDNCDFSFGEGTEMPYANTSVHVAEWNEDKTYYIKCRDEFRNEDADCSVVVRPTRDFL